MAIVAVGRVGVVVVVEAAAGRRPVVEAEEEVYLIGRVGAKTESVQGILILLHPNGSDGKLKYSLILRAISASSTGSDVFLD